MQFEKTVRRKIINSSNSLRSQASQSKDTVNADGTNITMYSHPPVGDISLHEFEEIAGNRLAALKKLEELKSRYTVHEEYKRAFQKEVVPLLFPGGMKDKKSQYEARQYDLIGHFALRLAFCRSQQDTKWFITNEIELFKLRFQNESKDNLMKFLSAIDVCCTLMEAKEKEAMSEELCAASGMSTDQVISSDFFKVSAVEALDVVRRRVVLVRSGLAFIPFSQLQVIVVQRFRTLMSAAMARANRYVGVLNEQSRLLPRMDKLIKGSVSGKDFSGGSGKSITRQELDSAATKFFPLCMSSCHAHIRRLHHLKHGARRQYGLFLKGIGLSLDEALAFFREEFTHKMDSDKFDKQYTYNIRHMYGKEGIRKDYAPFNCANIILNNAPAADDCHGCPFKHFTEDSLRAKLREGVQLSDEDMETIISFTKLSQFDKACTLHLEKRLKVEGGALQTLVTHPNQYYQLATDTLNTARPSAPL